MNPFRCDGPTLVNFSGGRTSGYMLRRILDAHDGTLPADTHVVFTNTGVERRETLEFIAECADQWNVDITWLERDGKSPAGRRFRRVSYDTAARCGEPFAELITERKFLPNAVMRFCTQALKIETARDFMRSQGYEHWTSMLGLRRDESRRVSNVRARAHDEWDVSCPLHDAGVTAAHVAEFWRVQPFDLRLKSYEGNCTMCFQKGRAKRERIAREHPEFVAWWAEQERRVGGRFCAHESGYAAMLEHVRRLPLLPMDLDPQGDDGCTGGFCTDRRRSRRPLWCMCKRRPGQPHALACVLARDEMQHVGTTEGV